MNGQRVTWAAAERLAEQLSTRDWQIIHSLQNCRLLTGEQLTRLHFHDLSPLTQHRTRRRVLERLTQPHVVDRLNRVIGGVRAGSTGWVYSLGVAGRRLMQLDPEQRDGARVRSVWTPSTLFLRHSLDVAEVYVRLQEVIRGRADFSVSQFSTEPACWWPDGLGGFLKPDAFVVLRTNDFDELVWLEVDRSTESLPTVRRKLAAYSDFVRRGHPCPQGVMPRVVVTVLDKRRGDALCTIAESLDATGQLFSVKQFSEISDYLLSLIDSPPAQPP